MEKNGEFKPEKETQAQKQVQQVIVKTAETLDQSKLNATHTGKAPTKK